MFNMILYILTIKYISAVPVKFRDHPQDVVAEDLQEQPDVVAEDCSWFKIHFKNSNHDIHIPDKCLDYDFVKPVVPECDSNHFPMDCTYALRKIEIKDFNLTAVESRALKSLLSVQNKHRNRPIPRPNKGDENSMTKWATTAMGKAILFAEDPCKPDTVGKPPPRHMDCDACWAAFIPYPCNCNCRGWNQIATICNQPCHERGEYSFDSGAYCHKPCDRPGQIIARVGCGLGHDRVCVASSGDCAKRWINRVVDAVSVIAAVVPGARAGMKAGKTAASLAWSKAKTSSARVAARDAARAALRQSAKAAVNMFKNTATMKNAFEYLEGAKDRILEEATLRFMTANMPDDNTNYALEIAKLVDPTGMVGLVAGWIPPSTCDSKAFCSTDYCEGLTNNNPAPAPDDQCTPYNGLLNTVEQLDGRDKGRDTCCNRGCGDWCGRNINKRGACWEHHTLGYEQCCVWGIPLDKVCGRDGQMAPCHIPDPDKCTPYGGILDPNGITCCRNTCGGYCGASNCQMGPGGRPDCCAATISTNSNLCGRNGQMAPCQLTIPQDHCEPYDGIEHQNGITCCALHCGLFCGAPNCDEGPGGSSSCCGTSIAEHKVCGRDGQKAPCHIVEDTPSELEGMCENWRIGHACHGEILEDLDLSEGKCILACSEHPSCDCVTWGVRPKAKCRLETGPGSGSGPKAQASSWKACELGEKCENWKIGHACNGEIIGDFDLSEGKCISACSKHASCSCVTWGVDPKAKCRLETGPGSGPGHSSSWKACELKDAA